MSTRLFISSPCRPALVGNAVSPLFPFFLSYFDIASQINIGLQIHRLLLAKRIPRPFYLQAQPSLQQLPFHHPDTSTLQKICQHAFPSFLLLFLQRGRTAMPVHGAALHYRAASFPDLRPRGFPSRLYFGRFYVAGRNVQVSFRFHFFILSA